jgi:hypothetical protein
MNWLLLVNLQNIISTNFLIFSWSICTCMLFVIFSYKIILANRLTFLNKNIRHGCHHLLIDILLQLLLLTSNCHPMLYSAIFWKVFEVCPPWLSTSNNCNKIYQHFQIHLVHTLVHRMLLQLVMQKIEFL